MEKLKRLKQNKVYKIISIIVKVLLMIIFAVFVFVVFLQRFSDNKISFFNYRMLTVITGSMEPKYGVGDVLISKSIDPSKIKVGDAVTYQGEKGDFKDKIVTHQVVGIIKDKDGEYFFRTKGLNNLIEDPLVSESQLYGVVVYKSFILSIVYRIIRTNMGFYMFIIIPFMYVIGSEIITVLLNKENKRRDLLEKDKN